MTKTLLALTTLALSVFGAYWFQDNLGQIAGAGAILAGVFVALVILGSKEN